MKTKTKKKKYGLGSYVGNLKAPKLAPKLSNELAAAPKIPASNTPGVNGTMDIISGTADMTSELLSGIGQSAIDNADPRSNPATAMKKANTMNTAGDVLKGAGKGASLGAVAGPWGAVIGGAAGALVTGIGKIAGAKKQRSDLAKAQTGWASDNLDSYQNAITKSSYIKGGTIKGAGTGKSDSINMKAKNGSFIVPSENADYGHQLGEEYLGWKPKEKADKNKGGVNIKASNSEVIFNPEEVRILNYHGVSLDSLAPNANTTGENSSGGSININPANKGKFTATKKATGKSTEQLTHSSNPKTKKRAIFAQNAKTFHHAYGGPVTADISKLTTNLGKKNKLAPAPYNREVATPDPNATFNVSNPIYNPLTFKNVIQKLTDSGIITSTNSDKITTDTLTKMIDSNPHLNLSYSQLKKGKTANPDNMGYYEKTDKPSGPQDSFTQSQTTKKMVKPNPYIGINQKAKGGPVVKTKEKASMTGAMVNYMNNPKDTGSSITTSNPKNIPVTNKQRYMANIDKWSSDPKNMNMVMGMGSVSGSLSGVGGGVLNKLQAIEAIANSPKNTRLGKAAQDLWREVAPTLSPEKFQEHADLEGLNKLGKYWSYGDVAKSTGYKKGGPVADSIVREAAIPEVKLFKPKVSTFKVQRKPGSTLTSIKPHSPTNPLPDIGFPEIAGAIQAAGGAYGLATAKRAPDIGVSETLKNLSSDVRKQAAYGLEPSQLNVLNNSVERSRRDTNRFITESSGSGQEVMAKLNTTLGTTIAGKENIAFQDAAEKARKFSNVINVDSQIAGQEFDVKRMRREDWYKNQEMFASLLSTGIENIIGARQFKEQQKTFRERDNSPVFSIKQ